MMTILGISNSYAEHNHAKNQDHTDVSEKEIYSKKKKKVDFRLSPVMLIFRGFDIELNVRVHKHFTVGPMMNSSNLKKLVDPIMNYLELDHDIGEDVDFKLFNVGVKGAFHINGVFKDGLYISTFMRYNNYTISNVDGEIDITQLNVGATVGYLWQWKHVNFSIGGGYQAYFNKQVVGEITIEDETEKEELTVEEEYLNPLRGLSIDFAVGVSF